MYKVRLAVDGVTLLLGTLYALHYITRHQSQQPQLTCQNIQIVGTLPVGNVSKIVNRLAEQGNGKPVPELVKQLENVWQKLGENLREKFVQQYIDAKLNKPSVEVAKSQEEYSKSNDDTKRDKQHHPVLKSKWEKRAKRSPKNDCKPTKSYHRKTGKRNCRH